MRRPRQSHMTPISRTLGGGLLVVATLAACGQTGHETVTSAKPSTAACPRTVVATEANAGKSVCVAKGGTVRLTLSNSRPAGAAWHKLTATSQLRPGSASSPAPGNVAVTYTAVQAGQATITAQHSNCPDTPPPGPGIMHCLSIAVFTLTVKIV
jgi:hypothetical protein